jgi:carboxymethylenebutenolidase
MGRIVSFPSNGATTSGYLAEPAAGKGNGKGVVVIQEYWGLNDHVKDVAERFAREGFVALAPDLYHGKVTKSPDEAGRMLMALNIAQAERDLRGAVQHLKQLTGKPVGIVGFCMGGALTLFAACANGKDVGACVVYYGGHPKVQYDFDKLTAPVLAHWAEDDDFANATAAKVEPELKKRGKKYEFHTYPGTRHAFFNDQRPEVYDQKAAVQSWQRTIRFLQENL